MSPDRSKDDGKHAAKAPIKKPPKLPPPSLPALRVKPTFMQKSKYKRYLDDRNFYRWFRKLLRRSPVSAAEHLRRLGWLCEHFATTPPRTSSLEQRPCLNMEAMLNAFRAKMKTAQNLDYTTTVCDCNALPLLGS